MQGKPKFAVKHNRRKENLSLYLIDNPRTPAERQQSGAQLTNIVVTDNNIKSFDRVARKYGIDYSLKKAEKEGKTEYLVFFKAKDVDVMTAAFKEYTGVSLKKEQRQSIRKKLEQAKERVAKHREITKEKTKDRGQVR